MLTSEGCAAAEAVDRRRRRAQAGLALVACVSSAAVVVLAAAVDIAAPHAETRVAAAPAPTPQLGSRPGP